MPFINSKVTVKMTEEKKEAIKSRLGEAVGLHHWKVGKLADGGF